MRTTRALLRRFHLAPPVLAVVAFCLVAATAEAALVGAEPLTPISAAFPKGAPPVETQVVLQLVVDARGEVESAVEISRAPRDASDAFTAAAVAAVKATRFSPSSRDGQPIRARIEYVVVFHPPDAPRRRRLRPPSPRPSPRATR